MIDTMDHRTGLPSIGALILCLAICFGAAAIGSWLTFPEISTWYAGLNKPAFNPPNSVFGPVWTVLYALMAVAMWRVWTHGGGAERRYAATLFAVQLLLNVGWSAAFFAAHSPVAGLAVIVLLLVAIAFTIDAFHRIDRLAAWLLIPYAAWVTFATALNAAIVMLN
jgi:tryptophan-rich sensory protein